MKTEKQKSEKEENLDINSIIEKLSPLEIKVIPFLKEPIEKI